MHWRASHRFGWQARWDGEVLFCWLRGTYLLSGIHAKVLMLRKLQMDTF